MQSVSQSPLTLLVFLGSARDSTPPKPRRLGERVARFCTDELNRRGHSARLVDPLDVTLDAVFKPHFAYPRTRAPEGLSRLAEHIAGADGYVMTSPEYNHSMSPALAHLLNHFASSLYAFKPSAIVTYSAGQWGGARAAVGMRTFLSELGCVPVSAMAHIPKADEVFNEDGQFAVDADQESWRRYLGRIWAQLEWWGEAAREQRARIAPKDVSRPFLARPAERNAPG